MINIGDMEECDGGTKTPLINIDEPNPGPFEFVKVWHKKPYI